MRQSMAARRSQNQPSMAAQSTDRFLAILVSGEGFTMRLAGYCGTFAFAVALLLMGFAAHADLRTAQVAYAKQDFKTAFEQFKELAELGQPQAQFNVAVMYVRGEGIETSLTYGYAWASLAGENGEPKGVALATELEPRLTPTSLKLSADIQARFSQASLNKRLLPVILKGRDYQDRDPHSMPLRCARALKSFIPAYPPDAARKPGPIRIST
jgi:TPR repeat protein